MTDQRPNPDELLERVQREEQKARRGKLKLFFGACAGVGKTFAMLSTAHMLKQQGTDVMVGLVETHGRADTAELLEGLEILPPKKLEYRGKQLTEFDLDAALQRKPAVLIVDELAHTNVTGSRHDKRWQDVQELLDAGIDVLTTVNVQHLESLNDIVGQITGIRVWETIPDTVFDHADEVTVVDLPADELLQRLKEGKVYIPDQAERAIQNFFRKGNLIALRELALRRTADRVDAQMREYREDKSIRGMWQAKERLLVCVGPGPDAEKLIRSAARLAGNLHADWIAAYVETPRLQRLPQETRDRILKILRLAQELGAETTTLTGEDAALSLFSYARSRNVSKLVVGKTSRPGWRRRFSIPLAEELSLMASDVDVYVVGHEPAGKATPTGETVDFGSSALSEKHRSRNWGYLVAVAICALGTAMAMHLMNYLELTNIIMLYLLSVMLIAFRFGRGPAILSSVLSVAAFDFFFVPPKFTFAVSDTQYILTFAVMLAVALTISQLTANMRYQARVATLREQRAKALYEMARELGAALQPEQILEIANRHLQGVFMAETAILLPDLSEKIAPPPPREGQPPRGMALDTAIAQWVFDHQQAAGFGTNTLSGSSAYYLPLKAPIRPRGVLALAPSNPRLIFVPEQHRLLETFASQIALALERVHFVDVAQGALLKIESERLRNSLLTAISHDLRTPLTALVGLASTLEADANLPEHSRELAEAMHEQAVRMSNLVNNLLDMARLQSGEVQLNRQWHVLEEIVGSALRSLRHAIANHDIKVSLETSLPLIYVDSVLIERVLCNLIENATKYTPPGSQIRIGAETLDRELRVTVTDNGPGLPQDMIETVFEKFTRVQKESATPGVGLGLAICKAIVQAHRGRIWAENTDEGGARFTFTLPLLDAPPVQEPDETFEEIADKTTPKQ
ncbi:MAG: two-component system sensor histidine kinase KdpD [Sulfuricaulis sp.]|uniref:two-component system sensor histidine kinase KdpD n=1 Tax=Sulfuricaulis sp. TaxID=2003553 RepID=UPI003C4B8F0D